MKSRVPLRRWRTQALSRLAVLLALPGIAATLLRAGGARAFACSPPRRAALAGSLAAAAAAWLEPAPGARTAAAFDNAVPEAARYLNRNAGPRPGDLGIKVRKLNRFETSDEPVLKECGYGPNCFSSTGDPDDPSLTTLLPTWKTPSGVAVPEAFAQLERVVRAYPPGQNGVDGGGFAVQTASAADGYLYAQFESLKKGKVDDVEFKIGKDGAVQVRSAGRFGMKADFGSNAKRLNYVAEQLRGQGWTAPPITKDTHPYYFSMNSGKTKVQCVGIDCPVNYELIAEEPGEPKDPAD